MFPPVIAQEEDIVGIDGDGLSSVCNCRDGLQAAGQGMTTKDDLRLIGAERAAERNVFRLQGVIRSGD
jgi:hypothetical protein